VTIPDAPAGRLFGEGRMGTRLTRRLVLGAAAIALGLLVAGRGGAQPPRPGTPAPEIAGGPWINSAPLTLASLRGRVVAVEFWTYG
jgi:hypothetical protein